MAGTAVAASRWSPPPRRLSSLSIQAARPMAEAVVLAEHATVATGSG